PKGYTEKLKEKGISLHEAVTIASMIEAESFLKEEKSKISEVIWNRLKADMTLGIDATLIYGIKDYKGDIKKIHLTDKKNLYNTRIHKGLPPGPICSPTTSSLEAVLNPTSYGYYYYVLQPGENKQHYFSRTLEDHAKHVKLLLNSNEKKD
ncbi:MAG: endolytic transglycosylase MltG, partial [Oligoflexales bacterium]|nr:endolytic transglycosylase MltG [Oligoflexales bacterium]